LAWLINEDDAQAEKAYIGDDQNRGDIERSPYLARAYPSYSALSRSGEFTTLARRILSPLKESVDVSKGAGQ